MLKTEFPNSDVFHTATAMIRARINIMPSDTVLLKLLEEERKILNSQIEPRIINHLRQFLRNKRDKELPSEMPKYRTLDPKDQRAATNQWSKGTDKTEEDGVESGDFDTLSFKEGLKLLMKTSQISRVKDEDQEDEYIFQRLKEAAPKSTISQIAALINYHIETEKVISMQQVFAHLIRRSIDSDFHYLLVLPHNSSSATDVQGSMYIKALIEAHHDLRPGASSLAS